MFMQGFNGADIIFISVFVYVSYLLIMRGK